ncbi:antirestriction protein [Sulfurirhabdus autotrophica]|uniref:Antirestriction protein n=1 Tax=Sulfurirhabdus autotrophica TaxID=1706046 RepID=A0A4R3Y504_9PROT|nr:antirestriction protein [Sulfurirhabdus autotrophica]TCV86652.1 antirestriction protein [Sulfurirhabdus autotrophica]
MITTITRQQVTNQQRIHHTADLFGIHFPLLLEPHVYAITDSIAREYNGGYWEFYTLSNGGFYMAPAIASTTAIDHQYHVVCENGFEGSLSADALGITACLYTYSHMSFSNNQKFAATCAQHYHWLREYMLGHPEAQQVLRAID